MRGEMEVGMHTILKPKLQMRDLKVKGQSTPTEQSAKSKAQIDTRRSRFTHGRVGGRARSMDGFSTCTKEVNSDGKDSCDVMWREELKAEHSYLPTLLLSTVDQ